MARTNPYVGLAPYTEADAEWFFGREREQRIIIANLRASPLTLLYGASGVGKSSVLLAGVLPWLRAQVAAHRTALAADAVGGGGPALAERAPFAVAVFRDWRDRPLPALAEAIRTSVVEASGVDVDAWERDRPFEHALEGWTSHVRTLLVILDQVEEYFLYHGDEDGPGTFAEEFPRVVNEPDLRVNFLLSFREDAWTKLDRFKDLIPDLFSNYLRVEYLHRAEARDAIVRPVEEHNRRIGAAEPPVSISEDLVEAVLDDVRAGRLALAESPLTGGELQSTGDLGDRVETPYLQLVMTRLWAAATRDHSAVLDLTTLTSLGGAGAIVSGHLKDALDGLSPSDQTIAADVFGFLVTPSKTKIAQSASDLAYWSKHDEGDVRRVLEGLSTGDRRILRSVPPPLEESIDRYEIFHDVLAEAVLEWRTGKEQERERHVLAVQLRAEERARRKERRDKLLRRLAIVLGAAVVGLSIALVPLLLEQRERARENQEARSVGLAASSQAQLSVDPELALLLATEALNVQETPEATQALAAGLAASRVRATLDSGSSRGCGQQCDLRSQAEPEASLPSPSADGAALSPDDPRGNRVSFDPDTSTAAVVAKGGVQIWQPQLGRRQRLAGGPGAQSAMFVPGAQDLLVVRQDGVVVLAPIADRSPQRVLASNAVSATISHDGEYLATASLGGDVVVRRLANGARLQTTAANALVLGVAFSPRDPGLLLVEMEDRTVLMRWREDRRVVLRLKGRIESDEEGVAAGFSPDGRRVVTASSDGGVTVWDTAGVERYTAPPDSGAAVRAVFNRDGTRLLTMSDRVATLRAAATGDVLAVLGGPAGTLTSAAFSPDGALVATGGDDGTIRIFESASGAQLMELRGHAARIADLEFTPDGRFLLSGDDDASARLWEIAHGEILRDVGQSVADLAFSPDGREVSVAGDEGLGLSWDPRDGRRHELARERGEFHGTAYSPDGKLVAFAGSSVSSPSRAVLVIDRRTGAIRRLPGQEVAVVRFSPDGRFVLTAGKGRPRLWTRRGWQSVKLGRIEYGTTPQTSAGVAYGLVETVESAAFSRDGRRILLTTSSGLARIINARTGLTERAFFGHSFSPGQAPVSVNSGDFSPDGRWAVTAGDGETLVWSARTGRLRMRLEGHTGRVNSASYSSNGRWILTAGDDQTVRVWEARTGRVLAVLRQHGRAVAQAAFSPNGDEIVSGDDAGVVRQYPCLPCRPLPQLRALAQRRMTRPLTGEERAAHLGQIEG